MFAAWPPLFIADIKNIWTIQDSKVYCQNLYQMCALVSTWRLIIFMWIKCFKSNSSFQLFRIGNFSDDLLLTLQVGGRCLDVLRSWDGWNQKRPTLKWQNANESVGEMGEEMAIGCGERERVFCSFCAKKSFCGCQFWGMKEAQSITTPRNYSTSLRIRNCLTFLM